jgi:hydrogenase maturation protease
MTTSGTTMTTLRRPPDAHSHVPSGGTTILACGARDRADDGAAAAAVALLDGPTLARSRLRTVDQLRVEDLVDAASLGRVVIADAAVGLGAGMVAVIPFDRLPAVARSVHVRSTHELPIADAVALAEMLLGRPIEGAIVAIGAADVRRGGSLSPAVQASLTRFARAIERASWGR